MRALLAIFTLLIGVGVARADQLPIINGAGAPVNMNVKADSSGALSSRIVTCDATNPDNCAPVDPTLGLTVNIGGQSGILGLGAVTTAAPTYITGQSSALSLDTSGNLRVIVSGGSGGGGSSSSFGAAFPATGTAIGAKNGANMVNLTADGSGNLLVGQPTGSNLHITCDSGCSPTNYPADESAFSAGTTQQLPVGGFFQTTATSNPLTTGQMGAFQVTANRALFANLRNASGAEVGVAAAPLQVSLANTGSNASALLVSFAANQSINLAQVNGVTTSAGAGAASTGSQRVAVAGDTATIAGSAPGTAGTASSSVLTVQGIASMTALTVAQPTGTNLHVVCDTGCSSSSAPADEAAFTFGTTSQSPVGGVFQTTATSNPLTTGQMGAFQVTANRALFTNLRNASGAELGVAAAPLQVSLANTAANGTAVSVSLAANQSVNEAQINGVTPLMGAGATGTGAQRVTVSQDTTTIAGSAPGTAGTASSNVLTVQGVASMTKLLVTPDANSSVNLSQVGGSAISQGHGAAASAIRVELPTDGTGVVNAAQSGTWTNTVTQATGSNLHVACDSGCSSSSAPADESAFTAGTTSQTPIGGFFQTAATSNPLTTGQMGAFQVTAQRALFINLRNASGTELGVASAPVQVSLANTGANVSKLLVTPDSVALPANQSVNESQINGVTPLMGSGATGTGSQRVTVATDTATIAGSAPGTAASPSTNVVTTALVPSASSSVGITPVVSGSAEASHVLKASAGNLYSVYAQNLTSTSGFLVVLNAASAPADGAITPIDCIQLPSLGWATIAFNPGPTDVFSTGITAVLTSAATCFTKTTGAITGFIHGAVK